MEISDFKNYDIVDFTPEDICRTGALLKDVQSELFIKLQLYSSLVEKKVNLIYNGITTGKHKSVEHKEGEAVDIYHLPQDGYLDFKRCYYLALQSGFRGIGVYFNKEISLYMFHFDLGKYRSWCAFKNRKHEKWRYSSLLIDPKGLRLPTK